MIMVSCNHDGNGIRTSETVGVRRAPRRQRYQAAVPTITQSSLRLPAHTSKMEQHAVLQLEGAHNP